MIFPLIAFSLHNILVRRSSPRFVFWVMVFCVMFSWIDDPSGKNWEVSPGRRPSFVVLLVFCGFLGICQTFLEQFVTHGISGRTDIFAREDRFLVPSARDGQGGFLFHVLGFLGGVVARNNGWLEDAKCPEVTGVATDPAKIFRVKEFHEEDLEEGKFVPEATEERTGAVEENNAEDSEEDRLRLLSGLKRTTGGAPARHCREEETTRTSGCCFLHCWERIPDAHKHSSLAAGYLTDRNEFRSAAVLALLLVAAQGVLSHWECVEHTAFLNTLARTFEEAVSGPRMGTTASQRAPDLRRSLSKHDLLSYVKPYERRLISRNSEQLLCDIIYGMVTGFLCCCLFVVLFGTFRKRFRGVFPRLQKSAFAVYVLHPCVVVPVFYSWILILERSAGLSNYEDPVVIVSAEFGGLAVGERGRKAVAEDWFSEHNLDRIRSMRAGWLAGKEALASGAAADPRVLFSPTMGISGTQINPKWFWLGLAYVGTMSTVILWPLAHFFRQLPGVQAVL